MIDIVGVAVFSVKDDSLLVSALSVQSVVHKQILFLGSRKRIVFYLWFSPLSCSIGADEVCTLPLKSIADLTKSRPVRNFIRHKQVMKIRTGMTIVVTSITAMAFTKLLKTPFTQS